MKSFVIQKSPSVKFTAKNCVKSLQKLKYLSCSLMCIKNNKFGDILNVRLILNIHKLLKLTEPNEIMIEIKIARLKRGNVSGSQDQVSSLSAH